jgi:replicative DNA helicase
VIDLPHDRSAEVSILGGVMLDPACLDSVRGICAADDFYVERHSFIWQAMCSIVDRSEPVDFITLQAELKKMEKLAQAGGIEYIAEVSASVFTAASVEFYAQIVASHGERRRVHLAYVRAAKEAIDQTVPIEDVVGRTSMFVTVNPKDKRGPIMLEASLEQVWHEVEATTSSGEVGGIRTYFDTLDSTLQNMRGGLVYVVAARPSVGKTTFALNVATRVASHEKQVLFYSLEQSHRELSSKVVGLYSKLPTGLFRDPQALASGGISKVAAAMQRVSHLSLAIDDTPGISLATLRSRAKTWKLKHGLDVIVVDYLQLMAGTKGQDEFAAVSANSTGLKILARELNVPLILLSQLSRESERRNDHRPQLSDLRSSGNIEQDADIVAFLYRAGLHNKEISRSDTTLILAKNRHGECRDISFQFQENVGLFVEAQSS